LGGGLWVGGREVRHVHRRIAYLTTPTPAPPHKGEGKLTWLALEPLTGRTHQLRVHCAEMGWPILGDTIYGTAPRTGGPGLQLHAREIVVPLYKNRAPIQITAPVPPHMRERLSACGWPGEDTNAFYIRSREAAVAQ
jgi:tRNA pseudouridine32 synthase / 23S rRNA pseudouridine746 synthase